MIDMMFKFPITLTLLRPNMQPSSKTDYLSKILFILKSSLSNTEFNISKITRTIIPYSRYASFNWHWNFICLIAFTFFKYFLKKHLHFLAYHTQYIQSLKHTLKFIYACLTYLFHPGTTLNLEFLIVFWWFQINDLD